MKSKSDYGTIILTAESKHDAYLLRNLAEALGGKLDEYYEDGDVDFVDLENKEDNVTLSLNR